jgi:hypothetical protein
LNSAKESLWVCIHSNTNAADVSWGTPTHVEGAGETYIQQGPVGHMTEIPGGWTWFQALGSHAYTACTAAAHLSQGLLGPHDSESEGSFPMSDAPTPLSGICDYPSTDPNSPIVT